MLRKLDTPSYQAYLVSYRLPWLPYSTSADVPASVQPVWMALGAGAWDAARRSAQASLAESRLFASTERAGLLAGLAVAELMSSRTDEARTAARRSLELYPAQWTARRILVEADARVRDYKACYRTISEHVPVDRPAAWDAPLVHADRCHALASFAWKLGKWEKVATHLEEAYPEGLAGMPDSIREDWFRLSLYRGLPDEATRAAASLIGNRPVTSADELLQTIVQGGWTDRALPLYRELHRSQPGHELVRRRLVALCIKEGQLDEARRIAASAPLRFAA